MSTGLSGPPKPFTKSSSEDLLDLPDQVFKGIAVGKAAFCNLARHVQVEAVHLASPRHSASDGYRKNQKANLGCLFELL